MEPVLILAQLEQQLLDNFADVELLNTIAQDAKIVWQMEIAPHAPMGLLVILVHQQNS